MDEMIEKAWVRFQKEIAPTDDEIEDVASNHADEMGNMPDDAQVDFAREVLRRLSWRYLVAHEGLERPNNGAWDVLAERARQVSAEGWTPEHDDEHQNGELATAAACYASDTAMYRDEGDPPPRWPWGKTWWKPSSRRRNLIKAGALILAEIERLDRAAIAKAKGEHDRPGDKYRKERQWPPKIHRCPSCREAYQGDGVQICTACARAKGEA